MATLKNSIVGREVFDKKNGIPGVVAREDGLCLVIRFFDEDGNADFKYVSAKRFRDTFRFTDGEYNLADKLFSKKLVGDLAPKERPKGAVGCGPALYNTFEHYLKDYANQDLSITFDKSRRYVTVKYNGFNIFKIYIARRSLSVICNEKSLTPKNKRYCYKFKNRRATEGVEFVFTKGTESPLMRSIITDGLYHRQIIDEGENLKWQNSQENKQKK